MNFNNNDNWQVTQTSTEWGLSFLRIERKHLDRTANDTFGDDVIWETVIKLKTIIPHTVKIQQVVCFNEGHKNHTKFWF
jgi:hypothetical protein